ncbi:MAG TPA: signal peptide peptidase SppA [Chitinophagaceae bacterium]|nr:signal peptide peptidase SppA [Chitinophagaceae bacterium]
MKSFFKIFFASLLSLVVFSGLCLLVLVIFFMIATYSGKPVIPGNSVLVVDLTQLLSEQDQQDPLGHWLNSSPSLVPGLFSTATIIREAAADPRIRGIYLKLGEDPNGLGDADEIRDALLNFRKSGKFIIAYGDDISQKDYYIAAAATQVFLNPGGILDFRGFAVQEMFLKGLLDRLEIRPQIFFDGKYKSATEPLRVVKMTAANRLQTQVLLQEEYHHFLEGIGALRHIDTANLAEYANDYKIRTARDAYEFKLVDGLKYNDEVMDTIKRMLTIPRGNSIHFISPAMYGEANRISNPDNASYIAVIYAEGDIVDGKNNGGGPMIAADDYVSLIRNVRRDSKVKAIVLRVNSPGGSALAAEKIWRELNLARASKPVVVSMGDYAASGGYYISCMADSIFAEPGTLTGSIGVFGVIPDFSSFFKDKLGITFDGVKTSRYADLGSLGSPLTSEEKQIIQQSVDTTYADFKRKVARGRKLDPVIVDSIAQGRVWTGMAARKIGLVDRLGNIEAAIHCAAGLAHLKHYSLETYPAVKFDIRTALENLRSGVRANMLKQELGDHYRIFEELKAVSQYNGIIQARMPYTLDIH